MTMRAQYVTIFSIERRVSVKPARNGSEVQMAKNYIFDMDGTLVDSMEMFENINCTLFENLGLPFTPEASDILKYIPVSDSSVYIAEHYDTPYTSSEIEHILLETIREGYRTVGLKKGVAEYIAACRAAGVRMCIATGTLASSALEVAERLGLMDDMEFLVSCSDVGKSKDHPDVFLLAAERLGAAPSSCVVFEDGFPGASSAVSVGFRAVGVYDSTATPEETEGLHRICERYIGSFDELCGEII